MWAHETRINTTAKRRALEQAPKMLNYFETLYDIAYPIQKLDLIEVNGFKHFAMENLGLITYQ